jgi:hypothetical protein
MKRAFVPVLVVALLTIALAGAWMVYVGRADPIFYMYPLDPHAVVLVQSPVNETAYDVDDVYVAFSLDLSEWTPRNLDFNPDYSFLSTVTCYLDWYPVWQETIVDSPQVHVFSVPLSGLSDGSHSVIVKAKTNGTYWKPTEPVWSQLDAPVLDSSNLIYFTVDNNSESGTEYFPTYIGIAVIASAAVVCAGLLLYFKKRRKQTSTPLE